MRRGGSLALRAGGNQVRCRLGSADASATGAPAGDPRREPTPSPSDQPVNIFAAPRPGFSLEHEMVVFGPVPTVRRLAGCLCAPQQICAIMPLREWKGSRRPSCPLPYDRGRTNLIDRCEFHRSSIGNILKAMNFRNASPTIVGIDAPVQSPVAISSIAPSYGACPTMMRRTKSSLKSARTGRLHGT